MLESVGRCLAALDSRGLLDVPDPDLAVQHFGGMMLWIPSNRVRFRPDADPAGEEQLTRFIASGAAAFQRAYSPEE